VFCVEQAIRDSALAEAIKELDERRVWFEDPVKHSRMLWEGLFFMFWHADKSLYQRDVSMRIAAIIKTLAPEQKRWS